MAASTTQLSIFSVLCDGGCHGLFWFLLNSISFPLVSFVLLTSVCHTGEADSETAALGYFITPCVGTLVTLISYLLLPHLVSHSLIQKN